MRKRVNIFDHCFMVGHITYQHIYNIAHNNFASNFTPDGLPLWARACEIFVLIRLYYPKAQMILHNYTALPQPLCWNKQIRDIDEGPGQIVGLQSQ